MLVTRILLVSELISVAYSSLSELLQFFFTASEQIYFIGKPLGRMLESGSPPTDADDSGVSVSSASSTALSAKQSLSDELTGVRAFCMISGNILNTTGDNGHPCRTPTPSVGAGDL